MLKVSFLSVLLFTLGSCSESAVQDDRLPVLTANPITVAETNQLQEVALDLQIDKPSTQEIIVNVNTKNGTAIAGSDYRAIPSQSLSIPAGEVDTQLTLEILGDEFKENEEQFYVVISSAINASIETKEIEISITDSDTKEPTSDLDLPTEGYSTPLSYDGYDLVWQDEFDQESLSDDWTYEIGTGSSGWGNNELQYYTEENTTVEDGYLVITAKEENRNGSSYSSSRIVTENKQEFKFGRIDIRAVLPVGQGIWPALWMLGANFDEVGWPKCGEIDIMEKIGGGNREKEVFGTLHWDIDGERVCTCGDGNPYTLSSGNFGDKFHVFTLLWDAEKIQWLVDDNLYHTIDITPDHMNEFREEFFFIFNVAVGGNLPGSPDATTVFPQRIAVDYIRVFQQPE
jgi:beta-glucanase (GH16 family)